MIATRTVGASADWRDIRRLLTVNTFDAVVLNFTPTLWQDFKNMCVISALESNGGSPMSDIADADRDVARARAAHILRVCKL